MADSPMSASGEQIDAVLDRLSWREDDIVLELWDLTRNERIATYDREWASCSFEYSLVASNEIYVTDRPVQFRIVRDFLDADNKLWQRPTIDTQPYTN
ncbi:hypothetical protein WG922_13540 [Ramlibacter sp. AN1015]|uniref:hypothetical protein n=1 Tax=Ramlibacter sp. AN1015 TaxID=3133428 RepID=UPI0030BE1ADE